MPNVKIIHQLRDPRGTVTSRRSNSRLAYTDIQKEAKLLCRKMAQDISERHALEAKYPGVFLQTRYEDLADNPAEILQKIYEHIDEPVPQELLENMQTHTQADNQRSRGGFGTFRTNSSATARAWMDKLTSDEKDVLDTACRDVFDIIGYMP